MQYMQKLVLSTSINQWCVNAGISNSDPNTINNVAHNWDGNKKNDKNRFLSALVHIIKSIWLRLYSHGKINHGNIQHFIPILRPTC